MASMAAMVQAAAAQMALSPRTQSKEIRRQPLPEPFTGWEARFVEVNFPAGVPSVVHKHPGFVLGYVTKGEFWRRGDMPNRVKRGKMKLVDEIETQIQSDISGCEQGWRTFFKVNCNTLFQTALLLTADAAAAESAVAESIEALDISSPPEQSNLTAWERAVVVRSIETSQLSSSAANSATRSMLQPGLLPVIQIERFPRICFVLRMLLGYSTALCAQMLGVEESHVRMLFQMAALQLQRKVVANLFRPEHGAFFEHDCGTPPNSGNA